MSPLTERGVAQAEYTAEYLKRVFGRFDLTFASDFIRTHAIPAELGLDYTIDTRIGERWQGQLHERGSPFFVDFPAEERCYREDYYNYRAGMTIGRPEGENCPDVEARVLDFLLDRELFADAKTMFLSSHGITGLCLRKVLLQASVDDWHQWHGDKSQRLANASVTVYQKTKNGFETPVYNYIPWLEQLGRRETVEA